MTAPVLRRLITNGVPATIRYARYRLADSFHLWRTGIRSAFRESQQHIDNGNGDNHPHDPSASFTAFRKIMRDFVRPTADDVFVDYGSGLGAVLWMASTFPFRRVIGVEYSAELSHRAKITAMRLGCANIELMTADASKWPLPDDVTVIYAFNPFAGPILTGVLDRIRESLERRQRQIKIVYYTNRRFDEAIAWLSWIRKVGSAAFRGVCPYEHGFYVAKASDSP